MHTKCLRSYLKSDKFSCPVCKKSIIDMEKAEPYFDQQFAEIEMPDEYKQMFNKIICNDCLKTSTVKFHVLGGKCLFCRSYNTTASGGGLFSLSPTE